MNRKINVAKLILVGVVAGALATLSRFILRSLLHIENVPIGYVIIIVTAGLVAPIIYRIQDQGVRK